MGRIAGNYQEYELLDQKYRGADAVGMLRSGTRNFTCYDARNQSKDLSYVRPYTRGGQEFSAERIARYLKENSCKYVQEYVANQTLFKNYKFILKVPVVVLANADSLRAYAYHIVPAFYESNTSKILSYSIFEEPERRFGFTEEIRQFMEKTD